jgi:hypothetical protein
LPNLIIIGGMKAGTTSLHYYLSLHPEISMSNPKELNFFLAESRHKDLAWYQSHFKGEARIHGEASPKYTCYPFFKGVPARMAALLPQVKLIYLVRDPIQRLISHYLHRLAYGGEDRLLAKAVWDTEQTYLCRSQQYLQLEQYLECFPPAQILVLINEQLQRQRRETLRRVFRFLEVEETFDSANFDNQRHVTEQKRPYNRLGKALLGTRARKWVEKFPSHLGWHIETKLFYPFTRKIERPVLDPDLQQRLIEYFRDDVAQLRAYTGERFEEWCV